MSLRSDVTFFWRYAPILKFACTSWVAKPILDEACDEIKSIAMHTRNRELSDKCFALLREVNERPDDNTAAERIVNGILGSIVRGTTVQFQTLPEGVNLSSLDKQAFG